MQHLRSQVKQGLRARLNDRVTALLELLGGPRRHRCLVIKQFAFRPPMARLKRVVLDDLARSLIHD